MLKDTLARLTLIALCLAFTFAPALAVHAETSSDNFKINEDMIGGTGSADSSSDNYSARDAGGSAISGESQSNSYRVDAGAVTPDEPTLAFYVSSSDVDLGALSTSLTSTGTATFSALNYTSYGYVIQAVGNAPDNGQHTLANMSSPALSSAGTEQFGINLTANTSPAIGVEPVQFPDNSFGFGQAASDYNVPNNFKYIPGDVVAQANQSSGRTDYTISFIANVSNNTPGGSYSGNQTLVLIGTY